MAWYARDCELEVRAYVRACNVRSVKGRKKRMLVDMLGGEV